MTDDYELIMAVSEKEHAIRTAAKLANALRDIYNDIGDLPEVKKHYQTVEWLVSDYAGLEDK